MQALNLHILEKHLSGDKRVETNRRRGGFRLLEIGGSTGRKRTATGEKNTKKDTFAALSAHAFLAMYNVARKTPNTPELQTLKQATVNCPNLKLSIGTLRKVCYK